jgi:hypothetical protein
MKKIVVIAGLSILLLVAMAYPAMAQWDIGVQVGDWFLYEGTLVSWEADDGVAFPPFYITALQTYNETNWMNYTITDIDADWVNFTVFTSWTNGSFTTAPFANNITGSSEIMVIGANLTQGELIRPTDMFAGDKTLNASIMLNTPNGTRETNVLNYSYNFYGSDYNQVYYWDKEYGIQVYYETTGVVPESTYSGAYTYKAKFELVNSSLGVVVPDLTAPILLLTLMSITALVALLQRHKKIAI